MAKAKRKSRRGRTATGRFKKGRRGRKTYGRRKSRGGRRKGRKVAARRRRRPTSRRRRRTGARRRRGSHFRSYRVLSRRHGPRKAAKMWRRRKKYVRSNPFSGLMPSMSSVTGTIKTAGTVLAGWVGANAVLWGADKIGLEKLKAGKSDTTRAFIDFGVRLLTAPLVGRVASKVGLDGTKAALGAGFNAVYHLVQALVLSNADKVPNQAATLLLGYDGNGEMGNYMQAGQAGVGNYLEFGRPVGMYGLPGSMATVDQPSIY